MTIIESIKSARRAGVPLISITTSDPTALILGVYPALKDVPVLRWDVSGGIQAIGAGNQRSLEAAAKVNIDGNGEPASPPIATANPVEALQKALEFTPRDTALFMVNADLFLREESGSDNWKVLGQAAWNCRDGFKSSQRTLIFVGSGGRMPSMLRNDVIELHDPVPTRETIAKIVRQLYRVSENAKGSELPKLEDLVVEKAVECLAGVQSSFLCENIVAMSFTKNGMDFEFLWSQTIASIERTAGLKVIPGKSSFDDIGGLDQIKLRLKRKLGGKKKPVLVVLLDEIGQMLAGIGGDNTGVQQDAFGQLLTALNDNDWGGMIFTGFAGCGKTELGKALGSEAGGLFISMDLGAARGPYVGTSEQMIRSAISVLKARGGDRVFFIGTTNSTDNLPAPLFRRFSGGVFFFDLLTEKQQRPLWAMFRKKFNIPEEQVQPRCEGWTGAEIRICCKNADEDNITLEEAAESICPVAKSMGKDVAKLRESVSGRFLSASQPGLYYHNDSGKSAAADAPREFGAN